MLATPHDQIRAGLRGPTAGQVQLLAHLLDCIAVLIDQHAQPLLADSLFRRFEYPLAANMAEDLAFVIALDGDFGFRFGGCHCCSRRSSQFDIAAPTIVTEPGSLLAGECRVRSAGCGLADNAIASIQKDI